MAAVDDEQCVRDRRRAGAQTAAECAGHPTCPQSLVELGSSEPVVCSVSSDAAAAACARHAAALSTEYKHQCDDIVVKT
jgi:hypothetical protein